MKETLTPHATSLAETRAQRRSLSWYVRDFRIAEGVKDAASVWLLTRAMFLLLTYFGVVLFNSTLHGPHPSLLHELLPAWQNPVSHGGWDTQWYINIASRGYDWKNPAGTTPAAFFPLYPLLIRVVVDLTHRSYLVAALVVSNLSFFAALLYMWKLAAWEFDTAVAGRVILYLGIFPTALFFFAGYSESLFVFLAVSSFYFMRRKRWYLAGTLAALASATRVTGVILLIPFAYEYARAHNFEVRSMLAPGLLGLLAVPAGLVAFMVYLHAAVGDAFAFSHGQAAWQKVLTPELWAGFAETMRQILSVQPSVSFYQAHNIINGAIGGLFLATTLFAARRLPAAYTLYAVAFWVVTLSSPAMAGGYPVPLISLSRYVLSMFPVFLYFGLVGSRRSLHDGYLVVSSALLGVFTVQFLIGGWII